MQVFWVQERERGIEGGDARLYPQSSSSGPKANPFGLEEETQTMSNRLAVHHSSKRMDWETPQELFEEIDSQFHFDVDVCATAENAKLPVFFTPAQDGLSKKWAPRTCWMNPPYGREIGQWMKKALEESEKGATVVCLVPSRTDTAWFHDYAMKGEIRFLRGRIKFQGAPNPAPFPSALVVFEGRSSD